MKKLLMFGLILIITLPLLASAARDTETIIEYVDSVKEGVPTKFAIESDVLHLKQVDFVANRYLGDIQFKIANMNYKPSSAYEPDHDIYEYFEIVPGKVTADDLESIEITFYILEEWIIYRHHDTSDVVLLRFDGMDWKELNTDFVSKSKELYDFKAKSDGFGFFAIAASKDSTIVEEQPAISIEKPVTTKPTFLPKQIGKDKAPLLTIIVIALIVIIAYFAFSKKKRRAPRKKKGKSKKKRRR